MFCVTTCDLLVSYIVLFFVIMDVLFVCREHKHVNLSILSTVCAAEFKKLSLEQTETLFAVDRIDCYQNNIQKIKKS